MTGAVATAGSAPGPQLGYRWFRVAPDGTLRGARGVPWPAGEDLRAQHVGLSPFCERRRPVSAASHRRRTALRYAVMTAGGLLALSMLAFAVFLLVVLGLYAAGHQPDPSAAPMTWARGLAIVGAAALYALFGMGFGYPVFAAIAPRRRAHRCPARPRRLLPSRRAVCGIYSYRTLAAAARAAATERGRGGPIVLATVSVWGAVYEHTGGFRSQWARINVLYDDGSGIVELPAARYGLLTAAAPISAPR